ncbi:unnamed protein product [Sphenostylis stenocarpa]|uniref:Uncharacterized protein n=1 Tax=Sphenostylis stenocarpa TaxID=92480 RepID=A0AA86VNA4_9FABA|nr:unnamed protein product [Sphenostylis stenocarpa]
MVTNSTRAASGGIFGESFQFVENGERLLSVGARLYGSRSSTLLLVLDVDTVLVAGIFIYPGFFIDFQKEECSHGAGEVPMGRSLKLDILRGHGSDVDQILTAVALQSTDKVFTSIKYDAYWNGNPNNMGIVNSRTVHKLTPFRDNLAKFELNHAFDAEMTFMSAIDAMVERNVVWLEVMEEYICASSPPANICYSPQLLNLPLFLKILIFIGLVGEVVLWGEDDSLDEIEEICVCAGTVNEKKK